MILIHPDCSGIVKFQSNDNARPGIIAVTWPDFALSNRHYVIDTPPHFTC